MAEALNDKERNISDAIKSQGFTGFREYINYIRLEHFKQLIAQNPKKNVKELMFACGLAHGQPSTGLFRKIWYFSQ